MGKILLKRFLTSGTKNLVSQTTTFALLPQGGNKALSRPLNASAPWLRGFPVVSIRPLAKVNHSLSNGNPEDEASCCDVLKFTELRQTVVADRSFALPENNISMAANR
ncbi:MAG: hypothetical protein MUD08_08950 [Cytophagales bacterium]|nr:hypothetical protein [Cytophagales bacterium]